MLHQPCSNRAGQIGWIVQPDSRGINSGDQRIERNLLIVCGRGQSIPEYRFQTDRGLVPGDRHAALYGAAKTLITVRK